MRKNYFIGFIACAALVMNGCSNDEIDRNDGQPQGEPIEFGTYLGRDAQARGTITATSNLKKFGVTAFYMNNDVPNFMYNQAVTTENPGENAVWTYSPIKYWPTQEGHFLSFYAYAPYTEDSNGLITLSGNNDKGTPKATITLPANDLTQMVDFVASVNLYIGKTNGNNTSDVVKFNLRHEMTRVALQANVSEEVFSADAANKANKTKVVIRSIKLNTGGKFYTKATYTFPMYNATTDQPNRGTWSNQTGTTNLNLQSILNWDSEKWAIGSTELVGSNNKGISLTGKNTKANLFAKSGEGNAQQYLFLIPVDGENGLAANTNTATISYDIITEDANLKDGYSITQATKTVYLPAGTLKQGVAYNLLFTIAVDQVRLSATVDNWNDVTQDNEIDVPYTPDGFTTSGSDSNGNDVNVPGADGDRDGSDMNG